MVEIIRTADPERETVLVGSSVITFNFACGKCRGPLQSPDDHVVWPLSAGEDPVEVTFLHADCDRVPTHTGWTTVGVFLSSMPDYRLP